MMEERERERGGPRKKFRCSHLHPFFEAARLSAMTQLLLRGLYRFVNYAAGIRCRIPDQVEPAREGYKECVVRGTSDINNVEAHSARWFAG